MFTLYFSGTGNSRYVARLFAQTMGCACHSIEDPVDFSDLMQQSDTIAFVYPIYLSRVPRILSEFVMAHHVDLRGKKLVILCTQLSFSGDGARCFTDLLPRGSYEVLYAEQINMPNNVNNIKAFPRTDGAAVHRLAEDARRQIMRICADIQAGVVFKRDFNLGARLLGLPQAILSPFFQALMKTAIRVSADCTGCGLCVKRCPMKNLTLKNGKAIGGKNCTACYRCLNLCPERAINLYFRGKVPWQYRGVEEEHNSDSA